MCDGPLEIEIQPAVRKRIGRNVHHSHHERTLAQEKRMAAQLPLHYGRLLRQIHLFILLGPMPQTLA
jgi:hypothetical protein